MKIDSMTNEQLGIHFRKAVEDYRTIVAIETENTQVKTTEDADLAVERKAAIDLAERFFDWYGLGKIVC